MNKFEMLEDIHVCWILDGCHRSIKGSMHKYNIDTMDTMDTMNTCG